MIVYLSLSRFYVSNLGCLRPSGVEALEGGCVGGGSVPPRERCILGECLRPSGVEAIETCPVGGGSTPPRERCASISPQVVVRDKTILDLDEGAERLGLHIGMAARQARTILLNGGFHSWKAEDYEAAQKRWLDVCASFTGVIEPCHQHAAWLDLSRQPQPMEILTKLRADIMREIGLDLHFGLAKTKWLACVAARLRDEDHLAHHYPRAFLEKLPISYLMPVSPEHRGRLEFLGYRYAGDVVKVPFASLKSQFGEAAWVIQRTCRGQGDRHVRALYPPDSLSEEFRFDSAVDSLELLDNGLRQLAQKVAGKLDAADKQATALQLFIEFEEGGVQALRRTFTKPVRCYKTAYCALKLMVAESPETPVIALRVLLLELQKRPRAQLDLLGQTLVKERDLKAAAALAYVRKVYGDEAVLRADQIQVPRRLRVLREWKNALGWR